MTKVTFDVSGQDPEESVAADFNPPKPGVYPAKIVEVKVGFAKGEDGKPDKTRPRLEPVAKINDAKAMSPDNKKANGAMLYDYISTTDEAQEWKLDQFLQACGIATKSKRKGSFDTEKLKGKDITVRIKGDTYNGEYKAKVGAWILFGGESSDSDLEEGLDDGDELGTEEAGDELEDELGGDDLEEAADELGGDDDAWTEEKLAALPAKELGALAKDEFAIDISAIPGKGAAKIKGVIEAILAAQDDDPFA